MLKESHILLGEYLIGYRSLPGQLYEKAFLWGCVEPDYNYFTYLKGSIRIEPLRGHNFQNARNSILRLAGRLQRCGCRGLWDYYRLGKLIHYISDAFTYPHNQHYGGSLKGHVLYEEKLHDCFRNCVSEAVGIPGEEPDCPVGAVILGAHRQYVETAADPLTDLKYILETTCAVFRFLVPELSPAAVRLWEDCESGLCEELAYAGHPSPRTAG